jgi:hypothetical protein
VPSPLTGRFGPIHALIFAGRSQGNSSTTFSFLPRSNGFGSGKEKRTEAAVPKDENPRKETVTVVGRDLKGERERETSETNDTTVAPFAVERSGEIESTQMEEGDEAALDCLPFFFFGSITVRQLPAYHEARREGLDMRVRQGREV